MCCSFLTGVWTLGQFSTHLGHHCPCTKISVECDIWVQKCIWTFFGFKMNWFPFLVHILGWLTWSSMHHKKCENQCDSCWGQNSNSKFCLQIKVVRTVFLQWSGHATPLGVFCHTHKLRLFLWNVTKTDDELMSQQPQVIVGFLGDIGPSTLRLPSWFGPKDDLFFRNPVLVQMWGSEFMQMKGPGSLANLLHQCQWVL